MTFDAFKNSLDKDTPPSDCSIALQALWYDAKGDWNKAHDLADGAGTPHANWVHAYLHRKEGDEWNAGYWYRIAGQQMTSVSFEEEWDSITKTLLL